MKYFLALLFIAASINEVSGQVIISVNNSVYNTRPDFLPLRGGNPANDVKTVELSSGSPYHINEYVRARLVTREKGVYDNVLVRINLLNQSVQYKDSSGAEYNVGTPLNEVILTAADGKSHHFINGELLPVAKKGWFLLLTNDVMSLAKGFNKTITEHRSYGSAPEFNVTTVESYFAYYQNKEFPIKKAADFIDIVPSKAREIEAHIKTTKKLSRDEQLASVALFCNTLIK